MNGFLRYQGESFPIKYFWKNNAVTHGRTISIALCGLEILGQLEQTTQGSY